MLKVRSTRKKKKITKETKKMVEERVYHVYLDNPMNVGGAHTRWMSGVLVSDAEKKKYCDPLFNYNPEIEREAELHKDEPETDKKAADVFAQTVYKYVDLPSVDSLAIRFPYTNGFLSGLVLSYKIIPKMRKLGAEKAGESGNIPVIISQCSEGEKICTHYVPLVQGRNFLVGQPSMEDYLESIEVETYEVFEMLKSKVCAILPFLKKYIENKP